MNELEKSILSGINYGLKNEIPKYTRELESENILKAIELDKEFQLGIFNDMERQVIIMSEKGKYLNSNPNIKRMIKNNMK